MAEASLPIVEQIAAEMRSTLVTIKESNDYRWNAAARRMIADEPKETKDGELQIIQTTKRRDEDADDFELPDHPLVSWIQRFKIRGFVYVSDERDTPIDKQLNIMESDIQKALAADRTRGGLANFTRFVGSDSFSDLKPSHIDVYVDVYFSTLASDPAQTGE